MTRVNIVAICGKARAGKDTIARMLTRYQPVPMIGLSHEQDIREFVAPGFPYAASVASGFQLNMADPLKAFICWVYNAPIEKLWGEDKESAWNGVDLRVAMQKLGTEWGRGQKLSSWTDLWIRRLNAQLERFTQGPIVVSDVRFRDEAELIKRLGGTVWQVIRPESEGVGLTGEKAAHSSEAGGFDDLVDATIVNGGTVADLCLVVADKLRHHAPTGIGRDQITEMAAELGAE